MDSIFSRFRKEVLIFVIVLFGLFGTIFWFAESQNNSSVISDDGGEEGGSNEPPTSGGQQLPDSNLTGEIQDESEGSASTPSTNDTGGGGGGSRRSNRTTPTMETDDEAVTDAPTAQMIEVHSTTTDEHAASNEDHELTPKNFQTNLGIGMSGPGVEALQRRLQAEGFFTFPKITGYFGVITYNAVLKYQIAHLSEIGFSTGFVGPRTRAVLNREE